MAKPAFPAYAGGRVDTCLAWFRWFQDAGLADRYPDGGGVGGGGARPAGTIGGGRGVGGCVRGPSCRGPPARRQHDGELAGRSCARVVPLGRRGHATRRRGRARGAGARQPVAPDGAGHAGHRLRARGRARTGRRRAGAGLRGGAAPRDAPRGVGRRWPSGPCWRSSGVTSTRPKAWSMRRGPSWPGGGWPTIPSPPWSRSSRSGGRPTRRRRGGACPRRAAARLRVGLTYAIPFLAVQTRLELARAYLELADAAGARLVLREIRDILQVCARPGQPARQGGESCGTGWRRWAPAPSARRR